MTKTIADALGELLQQADEASETITKNIISSYNQNLSHKTNICNMSSSKFKLESLENCANFLKIEIEDENKKKKYTNKADLADRLIMKIESLFPQTCQECKEEYCSAFTYHPDIFFECFLCTQLSHSCEKIKSKYESIKNCVLPLGMIWLCTGCHEKTTTMEKKG